MSLLDKYHTKDRLEAGIDEAGRGPPGRGGGPGGGPGGPSRGGPPGRGGGPPKGPKKGPPK